MLPFGPAAGDPARAPASAAGEASDSAASDLDERIAQHGAGRGARLMAAVAGAGIGFVVARTWEGDRSLERRLKNRKEGPRLCPICRAGRGAPGSPVQV